MVFVLFGRRCRSALGRVFAAVFVAVAIACPVFDLGCFVAGVTRRAPSGRVRWAALPWDGAGRAEEDEVYASWAAAYPSAAASKQFLGNACDQASIIGRFQALAEMLGRDVAVEVALKEPKVLLFRTSYVQNAYRLIKEKEEPGQSVTAISVIKKNPGLLTCDDYGLSSGTLESFDQQAGLVEMLRPFGPGGFPLFITVVFIAFLVVARYAGKALAPIVQPLTDAVSAIFP